MKQIRGGQRPYFRGITGGGIFGSGGGNSSLPRIVTPELGQLCPVGITFTVIAIVPTGAVVTCKLGANAPVAMVVVGNTATASLTPLAGDVGTSVNVEVTFGTTTLTTSVDVEADIVYWTNASNPAAYTAVGTNLTEVKNIISGIAIAKTGAPQLFTDPRISKPSYYLDGASYFQGSDPAMIAALSGSDTPFTTIMVVSAALATATLVPFAAALSTTIGNGKVFGQSVGKWFGEILGNPAGPARVALTVPVTAGISVVVIHSANSLTIAGGVNSGAETSQVVATVSPPALTPNRLGIGVQPSSAPTFPFIGLIYEIIGCGVNKTAPQIAAMVDRCVRFWKALTPQVVFVGDSITTAQLATNGGMPGLLPAAVAAAGGVVDPNGPLQVGQTQPVRHSASSGNTPVDMNTRIISATQGFGVIGGGTGSSGYYSRCILACLFAGTNPTGAGTNAQKALQTSIDYTTLLNNIATRLAEGGTGWRISVTTITPEGAEVYPDLFNAYLPAIWDAFDVAHPSNPLLRWDAHSALPFNPAHYVDITHPNNAGYEVMCNDPTNGLFQAIIPFILANQPAA